MKTFIKLKGKRTVVTLFTLLMFTSITSVISSEISKVGYINISAIEAEKIINTIQNVIILDVSDKTNCVR